VLEPQTPAEIAKLWANWRDEAPEIDAEFRLCICMGCALDKIQTEKLKKTPGAPGNVEFSYYK